MKMLDRDTLIIKLRESEKQTFKSIGEAIGTSGQRAQDLYRRAKRRQEWHRNGEEGDPYYGLSVRAKNCCKNAGLMNRSKIEAAIKDGRLHPMNKKGCQNYGWKSHVEIHKWLGLPEPQRAKPPLRVFPHCGGKLAGGKFSGEMT
jgi:hypothetical protein